MNETHDELAGVVDMFGGLTREELIQALTELAFKQGKEPDVEAVEATVADAIDSYAIVAVEPKSPDVAEGDADDETPTELLIPGPTAFATLPPDADDLPHILDIERREIDRSAVGEQILDRLRREADEAIEAGDEERIERLLDVSYDVEAWAPVEAEEIRTQLDAALES